MRALIVVLALVATPFLAAVSQSPQGSDCDNGLGDEHRSDSGRVHAHKGLCATQPPLPDADQDGVPDNLDQCADTPPGTTVDASGCPVTPPTGCVNTVGAGSGFVQGQVFIDDLAQNFPYLAGWCVELRNESGAVIATAVTSGVALDVEGNNYVFAGVPAGTYTVCQVLLSDLWFQNFPALPMTGPDCGGGILGYPAEVMDGGTVDFLWFGNLLR